MLIEKVELDTRAVLSRTVNSKSNFDLLAQVHTFCYARVPTVAVHVGSDIKTSNVVLRHTFQPNCLPNPGA